MTVLVCRWCGGMIMRCPDGDKCSHKGWVHLGTETTHVCNVELRLTAEPEKPPPLPKREKRR